MKEVPLIVGSLVLVAVLYIASIGPVWSLTKHGYISESVFATVYAPLAGLEDHCSGDLLWRYENWWAPKMALQ